MSNREAREVSFFAGNGSPMRVRNAERNTPCSCGSGKKSKKCCGTEKRWFHSKPDKIESTKVIEIANEETPLQP